MLLLLFEWERCIEMAGNVGIAIDIAYSKNNSNQPFYHLALVDNW